MILSAIVAMTDDRIIGQNGTLPWHIPEDLQFFKQTTLGHSILMGRTTFDSIGKPLPRRRNIVLTRNRNWSHQGVTTIHNLSDIHQLGLQEHETLYVIGGAQIYTLLLHDLNELIITHIHHHYSGDTRFPKYQHLFPRKETILSQDDFTIIRYFKA